MQKCWRMDIGLLVPVSYCRDGGFRVQGVPGVFMFPCLDQCVLGRALSSLGSMWMPPGAYDIRDRDSCMAGSPVHWRITQTPD